MESLQAATQTTRSVPKIIMLVGMPGSGKSTFAASLEASSGWLVVSSDLLREKKGQFEDALGGATTTRELQRRRVVVDRCSVAPIERERLMGLMHQPVASDIHAVFFDKTIEDCRVMLAARKDHPTISHERGASRGRRIIESFAKRLVAPTPAEGFGEVISVRSHSEAENLLRRYGAEPIPVESTILKVTCM